MMVCLLMPNCIYFFSKFDISTPGSATMYTSVNVQLLTHLVVDMQLLPGVDVSSLPGVNVSSFTGVDVKYLACVSANSPPTELCARQRTCVRGTQHLCT